jgi:hypothetical protein
MAVEPANPGETSEVHRCANLGGALLSDGDLTSRRAFELLAGLERGTRSERERFCENPASEAPFKDWTRRQRGLVTMGDRRDAQECRVRRRLRRRERQQERREAEEGRCNDPRAVRIVAGWAGAVRDPAERVHARAMVSIVRRVSARRVSVQRSRVGCPSRRARAGCRPGRTRRRPCACRAGPRSDEPESEPEPRVSLHGVTSAARVVERKTSRETFGPSKQQRQRSPKPAPQPRCGVCLTTHLPPGADECSVCAELAQLRAWVAETGKDPFADEGARG